MTYHVSSHGSEGLPQSCDKPQRTGNPVGRPIVIDSIDAELVVRFRNAGLSWAQIAEKHPVVRSSSGRWVKPSTGSIRRVFKAATESEKQP